MKATKAIVTRPWNGLGAPEYGPCAVENLMIVNCSLRPPSSDIMHAPHCSQCSFKHSALDTLSDRLRGSVQKSGIAFLALVKSSMW